MKSTKSIISVLFAICFILIMSQFGCEEQNMPAQQLNPSWFQQPMWSNQPNARASAQVPQVNRNRYNTAPRITFEKISHDFGHVGLGSFNFCEFKFTNTGNAILKIQEIQEACSCTVHDLKKKEYAPGESGIITVGYAADTQLGNMMKQLFVVSNDPSNPQVELLVKANHAASVDFEPKKLDLLLMQENANCPKIVIKSLDNQPFSITGFTSTGNCITADFNPSVKSTRFVLEPRVDMNKLERDVDGSFDISLSHPQCKAITGTYSAPPRFVTNPRKITVNEANPGEKITKSVKIVSNYNEKFNIEPLLSSKGIINVVGQKVIRNGYELELEITPPRTKEQARTFTDMFGVSLPGIGNLRIDCNGFYKGAKRTSGTSAKDEEECDTCGPKIVRFANQ